MVFCNNNKGISKRNAKSVTILILIDGFLQYFNLKSDEDIEEVTILILIDGFLQ